MKLAHICAALAFAGVAVLGPPAAAQHVVDPSVVHPGAVERQPGEVVLTAPMPALGAEYTSAPDGAVDVPWGDWIAQLVNGLGLLVAGFVLWVLRKVPEPFVKGLDALAGMLNQGRANELLEKAVTYGINVTAGAAKGKKLSLKVGNEVLERAFEYSVEKAPMFVRFVLGVLNVRGMIIARLDLDEDAALPATRGVADSLAEPPTLTSARVVPPAPPAPAPAR